MTGTTIVAQHQIPTVSGSLALVLHDGSTMYNLLADDGAGPVTVYLSHRENQNLMADISSIVAAMRDGIGYNATTMTVAGVKDRKHPAGQVGTLFIPSNVADPTFDLTVDDMNGGKAATVRLNQAGAEQLLLAAALMVGHL